MRTAAGDAGLPDCVRRLRSPAGSGANSPAQSLPSKDAIGGKGSLAPSDPLFTERGDAERDAADAPPRRAWDPSPQ
eukprot:gene6944-4704_t